MDDQVVADEDYYDDELGEVGEFSIVSFLDGILPEGWQHGADIYGSCFTLTCPHGHTIEQDGVCPEGCESPLMGLGLI